MNILTHWRCDSKKFGIYLPQPEKAIFLNISEVVMEDDSLMNTNTSLSFFGGDLSSSNSVTITVRINDLIQGEHNNSSSKYMQSCFRD